MQTRGDGLSDVNSTSVYEPSAGAFSVQPITVRAADDAPVRDEPDLHQQPHAAHLQHGECLRVRPVREDHARCHDAELAKPTKSRPSDLVDDIIR